MQCSPRQPLFLALLLAAVSALVANAATPTVFAHVVQDRAACVNSASVIAMCASRNSVCRMEIGKEMAARPPTCLPYLPAKMRDNPYAEEDESFAPWSRCDPKAKPTSKAEPICQRQFQCKCAGANACQCVPPDAVAVNGSTSSLECGSGPSCSSGQYCKYTQSGGQECGQKPYFS